MRIDVAQASQLQGTAVNIARINTNAESAFNAAIFTDIGLTVSEEERTHIFVTAAYQSYPYAANFLTISEVTYYNEDGLWADDRSQEFKVLKETLDGVYLTALGIRKSPSSKDN